MSRPGAQQDGAEDPAGHARQVQRIEDEADLLDEALGRDARSRGGVRWPLRSWSMAWPPLARGGLQPSR